MRPGRVRPLGVLLSAAIAASVLVAGAPAASAAIPTPAPVGQWPLDEGSGATSADSVGGHDVSLVGGATWIASPTGAAIDLDGSTGFLDSGASLLGTGESFTVEALVRLDSLPGHNATVAGQDSDSGHGAFFLQYQSSSRRFAFATTGVTVTDTGAAPVAGRWYQLVGVYDAEAGTISLYVDGELAGSRAAGTAIQDGNGHLVLGRGQYNRAATDYWPGAIDEAGAYQAALSAEQIAALPTTPAHPVGQWPLDEGSGTTSADTVGGHDLSLAGGAEWTAGRSGSAVHLDGSTGRLDAGASILATDESFTVAAVVSLDALPGRNATVAGQDSDSGHGAFFLQYQNASKRFALATTGVTVTASGSAPQPGRWYQLVGVYDADAGTISLYVDGELAGSRAAGTAIQDGNGHFVLGRGQYNGAATDYWPGAIDEAAVYQRALTAEQVAALSASLIHATAGSIDASGTSVRVTLDSAITDLPAGAAAAFSVANGANTIPVTAVAIDAADPHSLVLTTATPVAFTSYTVSTTVEYDGTGRIVTEAGTVPALSLADALIRNDSESIYLPTPWAENVDPQNPLPDYPRPQLTRADWRSLNGEWQFQGSGSELAPVFGAELPDRILVPFPMESTLSGVGEHYDHSLYRRTFRVPEGWDVGAGNRLLLNFGAIDYRSEVYVNGVQVAAHTGGYTGFTADVTDALLPGAAQELVVAVTDTTRVGQALGKQSANPAGSTYTPSSGIWQTVWMEPVPTAHIDAVQIVPDAVNGKIVVTVESTSSAAGTVEVEVLASDDAANGTNEQSTGTVVASGSGAANTAFAIRIDDARLWSPDDPYLYDLRITLSDGASTDTVGSYTGIRTIGVARVGGVNKVVLNGEPVFLLGTLDQGFYPDGLYTAPTDEALRFPLQSMKDLGFNIDRMHLKVDPARYYYWADKLGMMVMQDAVATAYYGGPAPSPADLAQWEVEVHEMVDQLMSSPSVVIWTPYNEHDGESSAEITRRVSEEIKAQDPSRLVDANSGRNVYGVPDSGAGDLIDDHAYPGPATPQPDETRAAMDGEHGGLRLSTLGHVWRTPGGSDPILCDCAAGTTTIAQQTNRYLGVTTPLIDLAATTLSGAILSQDNDVESETGGIYTYDRRILKVDADTVREVNAQVLAAGASGSVDEPEQPSPAVTAVRASVDDEPVARGDVLDVTVSVTADDGSTPTGEASARVDGSPAGDPVALSRGAGTLTVPTTGLEPGTHTLVVDYAGAEGFAASVSDEIAFTVVEPPVQVPAWSASAVYTAGDRVSRAGEIYTAAWWTSGEIPGSTSTGAWQQEGRPVATSPGEVATWTSSWIYLGGETVAYDGRLWQARWWTRNQVPGDPYGPWQDLGAL